MVSSDSEAKKQPIKGKRTLVKKKKKKKNQKHETTQQVVLQLDSLPEDILVHVGKSVLELVGAEQFVKLTETSKRIHRILMNEDIRDGLLESENERIFQRVFSCSPNVTMASTLEEMALCQSLAHLKLTKGLTLDRAQIWGGRNDNKVMHYISLILKKHPSAILVVDIYFDCYLCTSWENLCERVGWRRIFDWQEIQSRVRLRQHLKLYHDRETGCIKFGFRMGGIQLPPPVEDASEEEFFREFPLVVKYESRPPDVDPKEYLLKCMNEFWPRRNNVALLEAVLCEGSLSPFYDSYGFRIGPKMHDILLALGTSPRKADMDPLYYEILERIANDRRNGESHLTITRIFNREKV